MVEGTRFVLSRHSRIAYRVPSSPRLASRATPLQQERDFARHPANSQFLRQSNRAVFLHKHEEILIDERSIGRYNNEIGQDEIMAAPFCLPISVGMYLPGREPEGKAHPEVT